MKRILLALLLWPLWTHAAAAATYCVSSGLGAGAVTAGIDTNTGVGDQNSNPATACWKSLTRAFDRSKATYVRGSDTLIIRGGEYDTVNGVSGPNGITLFPSGTSGAWTYIKGAPAEKPILRRFLPANHPYTEQQVRDGVHLPLPNQCGTRIGMVNYPCIYGGGSNACGYDAGGGNFDSGLSQAEWLAAGSPAGYTLVLADGRYHITGRRYCFAPWQDDTRSVMANGVVNLIGGRLRYIQFENLIADARGIVVNAFQITCLRVCPGHANDTPDGDPLDQSDLPKHLRFVNVEMRNAVNSCIAQPGFNDGATDADYYFEDYIVHHCGVPYDNHYFNNDPAQGLAREHGSAHYYHGWYWHAGGVTCIRCEAYKNAGSGLVPAGNNNTIKQSYDHDNTTYINTGGNNITFENNVFYNTDDCVGLIRVYHGHDWHIRNNTFVAGPRQAGCTEHYAIYNEWMWGPSEIDNNVFIGFKYAMYSKSPFLRGGTVDVTYKFTAPPVYFRNNLIYKSGVRAATTYVCKSRDCFYPAPSVAPVTSGTQLNVNPNFATSSLPYYIPGARSTGINVKGYANGIVSDYLGNTQTNPPSIGAFVYCNRVAAALCRDRRQ